MEVPGEFDDAAADTGLAAWTWRWPAGCERLGGYGAESTHRWTDRAEAASGERRNRRTVRPEEG
jgi:hypothetical protein